MKKIVKLSISFLLVFVFCGCSSYTYDDVVEAGEREYERGYEDGYQEAYYDNVLLIDVINDLLAHEEYEAIDSIRKYWTNEGVFGEYVIDTSTQIIHSTSCDYFEEISYENLNPYGNLEQALENGYIACESCIY